VGLRAVPTSARDFLHREVSTIASIATNPSKPALVVSGWRRAEIVVLLVDVERASHAEPPVPPETHDCSEHARARSRWSTRDRRAICPLRAASLRVLGSRPWSLACLREPAGMRLVA